MSAPRFIVVDENISATGGHYLELASVILREAQQRGYDVRLWPSQSFTAAAGRHPAWQVRPTFGRTKMRRWSLGVDGHSHWRRDADGRVAGAPPLLRPLVRSWESVSPHPPTEMLRAWGDDFLAAIDELAPRPDDRILLSTGDDFTLLALAAAMLRTRDVPPLQIDVLFHLSLLPGRPGERLGRAIARQFAAQIDQSLASLQPHRVRLWATTAELAAQLNHACGRAIWTAVDYPIRDQFRRSGLQRSTDPVARRRLMLGGGVRTEKGKHSIGATVAALWPEFLRGGQWQLAMQLPDKAARRLLPRSLRADLPQFRLAGRTAPLRLASGILDDDAYARWITSADAGLFLYDGRRYFARCSGVLVEMLAAGVPVIVPAASWLSRQISPLMYDHLDALAAGAAPAGDRALLHDDGRTINVRWQAAENALLLGFANPRSTGDCIAVAAEPLDRHGQPLAPADRWTLDERSGGPVRVLVKPAAGAVATRIRFAPAFAYGAAVEPPQQAWIDAAPPESTVGLIAAGPDQLTRLLRELDAHHRHYRQTAAAHATLWSRQHSAAAFLDAMGVRAVSADQLPAVA